MTQPRVHSGPAMRALVLEDFGRMVITTLDIPAVDHGEVRVRVLATGICGSDLHGYTGENGRRHPGQVMGHETVGTVDVAGRDVTGVSPGDVVVINPTLACGDCSWCATGLGHICPRRRVVGVDPTITSAFADYVVVPESNAVPFTGEPRLGALVEPLAVGYHAARRGAVTADDHVLVLGGGPIGQASALACLRLGATSVTVSEPVPGRRGLLERLGVRAVDPALRPTVTPHPRVTIDAVGSGESLRFALEATAPGGTVVLVGMAAQRAQIEPFAVSTHERSVVGAFCYTAEEFASTARWAATVPEQLATLVETEIPVDRAPAAFAALAQGDLPAGKVLVSFGDPRPT